MDRTCDGAADVHWDLVPISAHLYRLAQAWAYAGAHRDQIINRILLETFPAQKGNEPKVTTWNSESKIVALDLVENWISFVSIWVLWVSVACFTWILNKPPGRRLPRLGPCSLAGVGAMNISEHQWHESVITCLCRLKRFTLPGVVDLCGRAILDRLIYLLFLQLPWRQGTRGPSDRVAMSGKAEPNISERLH